MSELNYLQFQPIDPSVDDMDDQYSQQDNIILGEQIDENTLDKYWEQVVEDIHQDSEWFNFADE